MQVEAPPKQWGFMVVYTQQEEPPLERLLFSLSPAVIEKLKEEGNSSALVDGLLHVYYDLPLEGSGAHIEQRRAVIDGMQSVPLTTEPDLAYEVPVETPIEEQVIVEPLLEEDADDLNIEPPSVDLDEAIVEPEPEVPVVENTIYKIGSVIVTKEQYDEYTAAVAEIKVNVNGVPAKDGEY